MLGANDGIVSVAAIVVGVFAGATSDISPILTAGVAGLVGGAISMALDEDMSVSSPGRRNQRPHVAPAPITGVRYAAAVNSGTACAGASVVVVIREFCRRIGDIVRERIGSIAS